MLLALDPCALFIYFTHFRRVGQTFPLNFSVSSAIFSCWLVDMFGHKGRSPIKMGSPTYFLITYQNFSMPNHERCHNIKKTFYHDHCNSSAKAVGKCTPSNLVGNFGIVPCHCRPNTCPCVVKMSGMLA